MSDDQKLWSDYARGVALRTAKKPRESSKTGTVKLPENVSTARKNAEKIQHPALSAKLVSSPSALGTLERKREKTLRNGAFSIDAKLDLHGMTQPQAFDALANFMRRATKAGQRHLLIITGKGGASGILRTNLAPWLAQLPEANALLALRTAAARHGGEGAFYVILRKT